MEIKGKTLCNIEHKYKAINEDWINHKILLEKKFFMMNANWQHLNISKNLRKGDFSR